MNFISFILSYPAALKIDWRAIKGWQKWKTKYINIIKWVCSVLHLEPHILFTSIMNIIRQSFISYASTFFIDQKFMQDGLILLARIIDLDRSSRNRVLFHNFPVEPPHLVDYDNCRSLVYLRVWDQDDDSTFDRNMLTLTLGPRARLYAGQTNNMRTRLSSDQRYVAAMGRPTYLLCFQHGFNNPYQKDALEVALIAYSFITLGLNVINKSPYAQLVP